MLHSIIIPHRNRNRPLEQTLFSIARSAWASDDLDYEIVIVDAGSDSPVPWPNLGRVVQGCSGEKLFNKSRALNEGIEASKGDVLTFLDADVLVGKWWMRNIRACFSSRKAPTRLCYRVRQLEVSSSIDKNQDVILSILEMSRDRAAKMDDWFSTYDTWLRCFEAYGSPDIGWLLKDAIPPKGTDPVFGNSQFSILRSTLGELRYNEELTGAGYEDIWMSHLIWEKYGEKYRGAIFTSSEHAILHMRHPRPMVEQSDWCTPKSNRANERAYYKRWPRKRART